MLRAKARLGSEGKPKTILRIRQERSGIILSLGKPGLVVAKARSGDGPGSQDNSRRKERPKPPQPCWDILCVPLRKSTRRKGQSTERAGRISLGRRCLSDSDVQFYDFQINILFNLSIIYQYFSM